MKLKGIKPIEQHCDKIVVALTASTAAAAVAITLLTQPNAVKPDPSGPVVPPAAAFESAEREAERLRDRLLSGSVEVPDVGKLTLSTKFDAAMKAGGKSAPAIALGDGRRAEIVAAAVVATADRYAEPSVPAPQLKGVRTYQATVSPVEWYRNKELAKLLPESQPFDKAFVTVEGLFNGIQLREIFETDPDGDGPLAAIPTGWWRESDAIRSRDLVTIVSVEIERQTIRSPEGESRDDVVTISGLPGRGDVFADWSKMERQTEVIDMLDRAEALREDIERPEFFDLVAGPKWVPPTEVVNDAAEDNSRRIAAAKERLKVLDAEILDLQKQADAAPSSKKEPRATQPSGGGGRGGKGGMSGGQTGDSRSGQSGEKVVTKEALLNKVKNKTAERKRVVDSLVRMGESIESLNAQVDPNSGMTVKTVPALLESDEVRLWAHDVTAQRGAAYRYRMRVIVNNPMFGRAVQESQLEFAKIPLLVGGWTPWSDPIEVDRSEYFFVSSADVATTASARPKAIGELFRFYYGYYRRAMVTLEPGDVVEGEARLPSELRFADMKEIPNLLDQDPGAIPMNTPEPGRGPRGPLGAAPMPTRGENQKGESENSLLTEAAPKSLALKVEAMLLDVVSSVTSGSRFVALFRETGGAIAIRSPESDRASEKYRELERSVREGSDQGKIEVKEPTPEPVKKDNPRDSRGGGGGGGGGGG